MSEQEGNKIIAEFMGWRKDDWGVYYRPSDGAHFKNDMQYHSSWDWLMQVYHKMRKISKELATSQRIHWGRRFGTVIRKLIDFDILETHKAIVKCLEWYNQNK